MNKVSSIKSIQHSKSNSISFIADDEIINILTKPFFNEVVEYISLHPLFGNFTRVELETQVIECLKYLYLLSKYPNRFLGNFLPVEQLLDEIWHYLIIQTDEYKTLCESKLPGKFFIHHRSLPFEEYQQQHSSQQNLSRESIIKEFLSWIPSYCQEFGSFSNNAIPFWTITRYLSTQFNMTNLDISNLKLE